ncbi:MAG: glycosyltransferase family 2 protein [Chloroflexi bacterium]|nr:MAG: glycosyltransferase family 2 protein [Chloroflexota bacterium]
MMGSLSPQISAVMPAFNEEGNLERCVVRLAHTLHARTSAYEIIVVDDGSQDGTAVLLERLRGTYPALRIVHHQVNRGYGAAIRSGFKAARYTWVFMMDSDNQFDPADIDRLLARSEQADIVTGYRRRRRDPLARRLNAWAFFTLVSLLFGRLARDVNCAFKLIRRDLLMNVELTCDGALINTELFVLARRRGARIIEVPVEHYPRTEGRQTGANPKVVIRAFKELLAFRAAREKELKKAA